MNIQDLTVASLALLLAAGCSNTSGSNGSNPLGFTPSNLDPSKLNFTSLGDIDCKSGSFDTQTPNNGLAPCTGDQHVANFTIITQPDGTQVGVWVAHSWRIEPGAIITVARSLPLIIVATDTIDIAGTLTGAAVASNPVGGGFAGSTTDKGGGGPGGGGASSNTNSGGGASYCGKGGIGAASDGGTPAQPGATYGTSGIVPLTGGSAGGGSSTGGGGGGAAIQLVAATSITIEQGGAINVGGGGGGIGQGGGGGSGGAILIEAPAVTIAGTVAANGGGGGSCGTGNYGVDALGSAQAAAGGTNPAAGCQGGSGSAGPNPKGGDGTPTQPGGVGGGGGGAGWIRINTKSGSAALSGVLSPDSTTSCSTQGQIH